MDDVHKQVNELRKGFEALNELLEKERNINETYEHNVKRTLDLHDCSRKYAVEKARGNINMEVALQLAFEEGVRWLINILENLIIMKQIIYDVKLC